MGALFDRFKTVGYVLLLAAWVASLLVVYDHGGYVVRQEREAESAKRDADQARADLAAYRGEVDRLHGISAFIETQLEQLRAATPKIIERYTRVVEKHPLPVDCRPGTERMRELNYAIEQANRIAGASVPYSEVQAGTASD